MSDQPILCFGGPYSNRHALEALMAEAARRGIPPARMICTGDVVAYCAEAAATLDAMIASGIPTVMGNCEENLAADADDCGCGFDAGSTCDLLSRGWYAHARAQISPRHRAWMTALPRRIDVTLGGRRLAVVHGGATEINRFLFPSAPDDVLAAEIAATGAEGVIAGHSGLPFTRQVGRAIWHNAGAIGMPADDGTPRTWFSVLAPEAGVPEAGGLRISHHALAYDHGGAAWAMREAGLAAGYAAALESGTWPSQDILPAEERRRRGRRRDPPALLWR